jgi:hypothetical protein
MARTTLGIVAGLAVWVAITSIAGVIMRGAWPQYASVAEAMTFTLPMLFARLAIGALAALAAGLVAALIARRSLVARLMPGTLLLIAFIPVHFTLWDKFPVWYHVTFLVSLVPLAYAGGKLTETRRQRATT